MSYRLAAIDYDDWPGPDAGAEAGEADPFATVVGESEAITEAVAMARRVAGRPTANVLLSGETGSGKEVFARAIHYAGPHPDDPFVAINCAAIPPNLLEAEMFGYEKGAFTDAGQTKKGLVELAGSGTLFLDEISGMPLDLQPKLLRVLEERRVRRVGSVKEIEIRCRVVAATNEPLHDLVAEGAFREDLFYRLNVLRVAIPALRERRGDVRVLTEHFLRELTEEKGRPGVPITEEAMRTLEGHRWPGNVRELRNAVERALALSQDGVIEQEHVLLDRRALREPGTPDGDGAAIRIPRGGRTLASVERELYQVTLDMVGWNKSEAARVLGVSRPTVHRKIDDHGLERPAAEEEG